MGNMGGQIINVTDPDTGQIVQKIVQNSIDPKTGKTIQVTVPLNSIQNGDTIFTIIICLSYSLLKNKITYRWRRAADYHCS